MIARPTDVRDPLFVAKLNLWSNQGKQDAANQKVKEEWQREAANWVQRNMANQEHGLPIDPPLALPVMTIYHDDFTVENPPFPDLKVPTLDPVRVVPSGGIGPDARTNVPPDRLDAVIMLLGHVIDLLEAKNAAK
jgi:hypothetical protein